jgi:hypothetical protein
MSDTAQSDLAAEPDLRGLGSLRVGPKLCPTKVVMAREAGRTSGG